MRRITFLFTATLIASSCSIRPTAPQWVAPASGEHGFGGKNLKPLSPEELAGISQRLKHIQEERQATSHSTQALTPKYAYKGLHSYRHIDQYTEEELSGCVQDELAIVVNEREQLSDVVETLKSQGYVVKRAFLDTIVVALPQTGPSSIRSHFRRLESIGGIKTVNPRRFDRAIDYRLSNNRYSTLAVPNDPKFTTQWHLNKINAPSAWEYPAIRSSDFVIGVMGTGLNHQHEEFVNKTVPGINSTETWSILGTTQMYPVHTSDTNDWHGHGTGVASLAAAATNNGKGISGSGWGSRIMPLSIVEQSSHPFAGSGVFGDNARAAAIWAVDNGAKVINCSWVSQDNWFYADLVQYAQDRNVVIVAAAPNYPESYNYLRWPFAYNNPNIIPVVAIDENDAIYESSVKNGVLFAAPGKNLEYASIGGVSSYDSAIDAHKLAAPIVSGAFASLWSAARALPYWQIKDVFHATGKSITPLGNDFVRINFGEAAEYLLGSGVIYRWVDNYAPNLHAWTDNPSESPLVWHVCNNDPLATAKLTPS